MNSEQKVRIVSPKELIVFLLGLLGQVIVFVVSYLVNALNTDDTPLKKAVFDCFIIIVVGVTFGLICWYIVYKIMNDFKNSEEKGREQGLSKIKETNKEFCKKDNSLLCPLNIGFNKSGIILKIDAATSQKDRLYEKDHVYKKEIIGSQGKPWRDIWIFSEDLSSEIDPINNNKAEPVLITNIASNGTKYKMFYLNNKTKVADIANRKTTLLNSLPESCRHQLTFVPIDNSNGYIGKNSLPLLCGSIMFSQFDDTEGSPFFSEGYLSIRKDKEDTPIYYRMPRCMLGEYAKYFKTINNKNKESKGSKP